MVWTCGLVDVWDKRRWIVGERLVGGSSILSMWMLLCALVMSDGVMKIYDDDVDCIGLDGTW